MVLPLRQREVQVPTLEHTLWERVDLALSAREAGDGAYFDTVIEHIEMLMKSLKVGLYKELIAFKKDQMNKAEHIIEHAWNESSKMKNEIRRRAYFEGDKESIIWDLRASYLQRIIELLGTNNMIPSESSEAAILSEPDEDADYVVDEEDDYDDEEEEDDEEEPEPEPQQPKRKRKSKKKKMPKLSIKPKDDEDFDL